MLRSVITVASLAVGTLLFGTSATLAQGLVPCAPEHGFCRVPYPTRVIYGVPGRSAERDVRGGGTHAPIRPSAIPHPVFLSAAPISFVGHSPNMAVAMSDRGVPNLLMKCGDANASDRSATTGARSMVARPDMRTGRHGGLAHAKANSARSRARGECDTELAGGSAKPVFATGLIAATALSAIPRPAFRNSARSATKEPAASVAVGAASARRIGFQWRAGSSISSFWSSRPAWRQPNRPFYA